MSRITELQKIINDAHAEIKQIQEECSHPVSCVTKEYSASTGNWNKYDNSYAITLHCELCGKSWGFSYSEHDDYNNNGKREKYLEASKKYTRKIK